MKIRETIASDLEPERLRNARVICLPGQALQEVTEVYLPLGIAPENIICIEQDSEVARTMKSTAKALNLPITIFEGAVQKFLKSPHEPVTIASFDFLGPVHESFLDSLEHLRTAEKYVIITNFLQRRERSESQTRLRVSRSVTRDKQDAPIPNPRDVKFGSEFLKARNDEKSMDEHLSDITTGRTSIELSEARDRGMSMNILSSIAAGRVGNALNELYAEAGTSPPPFTSEQEGLNFIAKADQYVVQIIEKAFEKYPGLLMRLTPTREEDASGTVIRYSNSGKQGFLFFLATIISDCFVNRMLCDVQRYEYTSESAGSPYQTDIVSELDWGPDYKRRNRAAYDFIREFFRIVGRYGRDAVTVRFEKFGKVLPQTYSESAVGITLSLCVNDVPQSRVTLHNLQKLINHYTRTLKSHLKKDSEELFARPRIKIQVP
jgi:hypothetical protein